MRVIASGFLAAGARAVVECPFEYAKVKRQTGQTYAIRNAYTGFSILYIRTSGLMTSYFIMIDTIRRKTNAFHSKLG